jgi:hypothetical protein
MCQPLHVSSEEVKQWQSTAREDTVTSHAKGGWFSELINVIYAILVAVVFLSSVPGMGWSTAASETATLSSQVVRGVLLVVFLGGYCIERLSRGHADGPRMRPVR